MTNETFSSRLARLRQEQDEVNRNRPEIEPTPETKSSEAYYDAVQNEGLDGFNPYRNAQ